MTTITSLPREIVISNILPSLSSTELYRLFFTLPEYQEYIWKMGVLTQAHMLLIARKMPKSVYNTYLQRLPIREVERKQLFRCLQEGRVLDIQSFLLSLSQEEVVNVVTLSSEETFEAVFPLLALHRYEISRLLARLAFTMDLPRIHNIVSHILSILGPLPGLLSKILDRTVFSGRTTRKDLYRITSSSSQCLHYRKRVSYPPLHSSPTQLQGYGRYSHIKVGSGRSKKDRRDISPLR